MQARSGQDDSLRNQMPTYVERAEDRGMPTSTFWHREHGRPSMQEKAIKQQYLTLSEESALVKYVLQSARLGCPVPAKKSPQLAAIIKGRRGSKIGEWPNDNSVKPPSTKWVQGFYKRHPEVVARRVKAIDWLRHDHTIYDKVVAWYGVIEPEIRQVQAENMYNMDETGVLLGVPHTIKVLCDGRDLRGKRVRGASVNRTLITAVECIAADGRSLPPLVIWPAASHRSNWTTHSTPGWHYACSKTGYTNGEIHLQWLQQVFEPGTAERARGQTRHCF